MVTKKPGAKIILNFILAFVISYAITMCWEILLLKKPADEFLYFLINGISER